MIKEYVVLVDANDCQIGTMEKMEAHEKALLHRAFSIFLFDSEGRMLVQQRAWDKYHSAGLWTNACCSHPRPEEQVLAAAQRRLGEELGIQTPLEPVFSYTYQADMGNGLIEHEYDHIFIGQYEGDFDLNPSEVAQIAYRTMDSIAEDIKANPAAFTAWFKALFPQVSNYLTQVTI
ncbi:isopentenyl-diphosphate Delta-isomerase [Sphingobacteriaceae bacterium WQ 2009]|uniref:Isopentenyl-diphosphate delta-isomerase n=1 Tax=Rhinopithecimicrobium faecis TaxID=2820698 RepID=A0A8T4H8L3_9SPHI|nr:isopentenyl-diphosphate Delta-isomerase [Sphingobacteriaceae bacterium WQ 2009]